MAVAGRSDREESHSRVLPCTVLCINEFPESRHWLVSDRDIVCVRSRRYDACWHVTVRFRSFMQPDEGPGPHR